MLELYLNNAAYVCLDGRCLSVTVLFLYLSLPVCLFAYVGWSIKFPVRHLHLTALSGGLWWMPECLSSCFRGSSDWLGAVSSIAVTAYFPPQGTVGLMAKYCKLAVWWVSTYLVPLFTHQRGASSLSRPWVGTQMRSCRCVSRTRLKPCLLGNNHHVDIRCLWRWKEVF